MKKILLATLFAFVSLSSFAQSVDTSRRNIIKLNLVTPFSLTPTFEMGYERLLNTNLGLEFSAGFVTGMVSELASDPFGNTPQATPLGYRLTVAPKFYVEPKGNMPGSGVYIAPTIMFKQIFDTYDLEYGMGSDNFGWYDYIQTVPADYRKEFIDFSIRFGYQTRQNFAVDFYGGLGVRWRHMVETTTVNQAYEGQPYQRLSQNPYNDFLIGMQEPERSSFTYSMPIGVKLGYRF